MNDRLLTERGAMFGMYDEKHFIAGYKDADLQWQAGAFVLWSELTTMVEEALQLDGYLKILKAILKEKYPDLEQASPTAKFNEKKAYVRFDHLFLALNDSMMINMVPRYQNLGETKTNLMLIKVVAQFLSQKPCRMTAKAIRKGINAYRLSCCGDPNADSAHDMKVKIMVLDVEVLHRALKMAGVTIGTE